jgi:hypothetical protein
MSVSSLYPSMVVVVVASQLLVTVHRYKVAYHEEPWGVGSMLAIVHRELCQLGSWDKAKLQISLQRVVGSCVQSISSDQFKVCCWDIHVSLCTEGVTMKVSLVYYYFSDKDWVHKFSVMDGIRKVLQGFEDISLEESLHNSIAKEGIRIPVRIRLSEIWTSTDIELQGFGCYCNGKPPVKGLITRFIYKSSVEGQQPIYTHGQFHIEFLESGDSPCVYSHFRL